MTAPAKSPRVVDLGHSFDIIQAARRLSVWPGMLWLDSSSTGPKDRFGDSLGRYSFLTANPTRQIVARIGDADPWLQLKHAIGELPICDDPELPPFAGGWAGLLGYESATWIEPIPASPAKSLANADFHFGLYDWTIAMDHAAGSAQLIVQPWGPKPIDALVEQVLHQLQSEPPSSETGPQANSDDEFPPRQFPPDGFVATDRPGVADDMTGEALRDAIAQIVEAIRDGDSFQVNLSHTLSVTDRREPLSIYENLRMTNPAPFAGYYDASDFQVLSSSPEGFLRLRDRDVETRPIKGTVRRTGQKKVDRLLAKELSASEKDRAENVMIVDLMRNDLSKVCQDDSIKVESLCEVERYQYVQHLVSVVTGRLRQDCDVIDLLRAAFPGGSVTGAPKIEAMQTIARLEKHRRGPYCGSLGYIGPGGHADFNILIRTITHRDGSWSVPVGGGITARSEPDLEEAETWVKAEGMLRAFE